MPPSLPRICSSLHADKLHSLPSFVLDHSRVGTMTEHFPTVDILRYIGRFKWLILGLVVVSAAAAYFWARAQPEYYKATINCVPPSSELGGLGNALGGLSSTLKDIGLSKLSGKSSESFEFIAILFTRTIRDSMIKRFDLVREYELEGEVMDDVRSELDENLEVNFRPEGNYEISAWSRTPEKSVEMCKAFVNYANEINNRIQREEAAKSATYMEQRLVMMDSTLAALTDSLSRYSREYRLFSPLDQAQASARALSDVKAELLKQETILGLLAQNYGKEDPQVRNQSNLVQQLRTQFESAQTQPGFAGNFALTDATGIGASYMLLYADFEAHTKLKAFLMPSLEQARLDMNKTAPALIVVDDPEVPQKRDKPKRMFIAAGTGIGIGIITLLILLAVRGWNMMMARANEPVDSKA